MIEFKLKSIYLEQNHHAPLQVKETVTEDVVILRVGGHKIGTKDYHHFRVPVHATVDIRYEAPSPNSILRIIFQLEKRNLTIQYFSWDENEQRYIEAPLDHDILQSRSFQHILQSISFSGPNHYSYIINSYSD